MSSLGAVPIPGTQEAAGSSDGGGGGGGSGEVAQVVQGVVRQSSSRAHPVWQQSLGVRQQ
jgi:hypothetical protein